MPETPELLSKEDFIQWVSVNFKAWAGSDARRLSNWLYSLEMFAEAARKWKGIA